jgi:chromate transporter
VPEGQTPPQPRSLTELFVTYSSIALQSFGGALAITERTIVKKKRWLSAQDFVGMYGICQALPGPTGIAMCVLMGDRFFGLRGACAALAGFLLPAAVLVLALASVFAQFQHVPEVQGALHGMGAAAAALILHTAARMARTLRGQRVAMLVALLSVLAVAVLRLPVAAVVLSLGLASTFYAWWVLKP